MHLLPPSRTATNHELAAPRAQAKRCGKASELPTAINSRSHCSRSRTAAKAGLMADALEIEKLKFQLARLRRQRFGSSSERIEREIQRSS